MFHGGHSPRRIHSRENSVARLVSFQRRASRRREEVSRSLVRFARVTGENYASRVNLEAKPCLQLDDAAAEGVGPLSERAVGRGHGLRGRCAAASRRDIDGADLLRAERSEVELIE